MSEKDEDITMSISTAEGTTGPMSLKRFREGVARLREIPLDERTEGVKRRFGRKGAGAAERPDRRLLTEGDPEDCFIEFPIKEDFEEHGCEYFIAIGGSGWGTIEAIGQALIRERLPALAHVSIGYLWKRKGGQRGGKAILGKAVKANPLVRTFTDRKGFVVLGSDHLQRFKLTRYQVEALIFHELLHFRYDEGQLDTYGHDFEGFRQEVEYYGLWEPDLKLAGEAFAQIELPGVRK